MFSSVLQRIHRSFRLATHLRDADAALYRAKGRGGTNSLSAMSFRPNYEPQMNRAGQESQSRKSACCPTGAPSCSCSEIQPSRRWRAKEPSSHRRGGRVQKAPARSHGASRARRRSVPRALPCATSWRRARRTFLETLSFARSPSRCQGRAGCASKRIRRDRFPDRHQAVTSVRVFAAAS